MAYLGTPPQSGFITTAKQRVTSSTNNYVDLDHSISSIADVIVFVNFVKQDTTNLTLTTSTRITLGGTLVSSDVVEIHYLGKAVNTQTPATGTVTNDMLAGSIANSKLANSSITLNGSAVSLGGSATVGSNMTPLFYARANSEQTGLSDNVTTKKIFGNEIFDTDNVYDPSTGLFTVPSAGKYCIIAGLNIDGGSNTGTEFAMGLSLNSDTSATGHTFLNFNSASLKRWDANLTVLASLSGGNTVGVYGRMNTSSGTWNMYSSANSNYFGAFKLIE